MLDVTVQRSDQNVLPSAQALLTSQPAKKSLIIRHQEYKDFFTLIQIHFISFFFFKMHQTILSTWVVIYDGAPMQLVIKDIECIPVKWSVLGCMLPLLSVF